MAIGHQWWWEFRYPGPDGEVITANEMHVPVGRPIWLRLESADVIHSFWVPRLAGKMDLIPGHTNYTWFSADRKGIFLGQCAEYCGTQHAHMLIRVYADEPAELRLGSITSGSRRSSTRRSMRAGGCLPSTPVSTAIPLMA